MAGESAFRHSSKQEQSLQPAGSRRSPVFFWLIAAVMLIAAVAYRMAGKQQEAGRSGAEHPAIGNILRGVSLAPLTGDGEPISDKDLRGKVALINFWGTWCDPCMIEFPHLMEIEAHYRENEVFRFVSVSCGTSPDDDPDLADSTQAFLKTHKADFPTYRDPDARTRLQVSEAAGLDGNFFYPVTILLDPDGVIRGLWLGYKAGDEVEMQKAVGQLVRETRPAS